MTQTLLDTQNEPSIILDLVPAWIFYKNKDNTFIRVNNTFCEAMGKKKEELEGVSLFDIYSKEEAEAFWKDDKEVMESGESKRNIIEQVNTPQGLKWLKTDKVPYRDSQNTIIGVIGFSFDITDQKKAEDVTKKSQIMLQRIIDLLPIRIFWKDTALVYMGCNKVFAKDAGKSAVEDVIGKDDYQMGWKTEADSYRQDDNSILTTKVPRINYEEIQTTPEGKTIWLNTNKVPLVDDTENILGVLGTYVDITEQKLAADKLREALEETKRMNELMVGRELKMVELKNRIEQLEAQQK